MACQPFLMTRSPASGVSRRRPPAIQPVRKLVRIDSAEVTHRPPSAEPIRAELPNMVLRLPEIPAELPVATASEVVAPPSAENDRLKIVCVAAAIVLLAVLFFSSAEQPANRPLDPLSPTPLAPATTSPEMQTAPPWQAPVVSVPPAPDLSSQSGNADRPAYRTADRSVAPGDAPSRPSVRFEGSIEKQPLEFHHERP